MKCNEYIKKIKTTYRLLENGKLKLNSKYYGFFHRNNKNLFTKSIFF